MKKPSFFKFFGNNERFDRQPYDPETQTPVIRASICTGERAAGFKDKKTGKFTEIMLIRSQSDIDRFKKQYGVDELPTEY